jgi:aspartyl-tRNA synthetase
MPGLGYIQYGGGDEAPRGPVAKFLDGERLARIRETAGLAAGDAVFFVCDAPTKAWRLAGLVRTRLGEELELIEPNTYRFCWVVDFPMYEYDEQAKAIAFSHNPFSMPQGGLEALETQDPLEILAYQYDIVCNGVELSSGAIRNHRPDIMVRAFAIAGYDEAELERRFGGMLRALRFGAPPHGGIAPGIDRIIMLIANQPNLREVTAFPLNQQAEELLLGAPSRVSERHLRELHIQLSMTAREALREEEEEREAEQARSTKAATG